MIDDPGADDGDAADPGDLTPAAATLGKRLVAFDAHSGVAHLTYEARPEFANRYGSVGGGFLAAMLDSACAVAILQTLEPGAGPVTTRIDVEYVRPAPVGRLLAVSRVVSHDDRDAVCEGDLSTPDGTVVARATATFRILRRRS